MLRIRLRRTGKKKQPSYRIVVADSRAPRDGDFVETLGTYQPLSEPSTIVLDEERAKHWLSKGAQPSDRVWKILAVQGIAEIPSKLQTRIELGKRRAEEAKSAKPKEEAAPAAAAPAEQPAAGAAAEQGGAEEAADTEPAAPTAEAQGEPVAVEEESQEPGADTDASAEPPAEESAE